MAHRPQLFLAIYRVRSGTSTCQSTAFAARPMVRKGSEGESLEITLTPFPVLEGNPAEYVGEAHFSLWKGHFGN